MILVAFLVSRHSSVTSRLGLSSANLTFTVVTVACTVSPRQAGLGAGTWGLGWQYVFSLLGESHDCWLVLSLASNAITRPPPPPSPPLHKKSPRPGHLHYYLNHHHTVPSCALHHHYISPSPPPLRTLHKHSRPSHHHHYHYLHHHHTSPFGARLQYHGSISPSPPLLHKNTHQGLDTTTTVSSTPPRH